MKISFHLQSFQKTHIRSWLLNKINKDKVGDSGPKINESRFEEGLNLGAKRIQEFKIIKEKQT